MRRQRWLHLVHPAALAPLVVGIWDLARGNLSVNPIQDITHRSGYTALVLLVLSLACTPASALLGQKWALKLRRPLGLYAFLYAAVHLLIFVALDYGLDLGLIWAAIAEKRFVLAGLAAFLLLVPLALTSTKGWQRRLGRRWKLLHRLVYLAAPLAAIHFIWLVKADIREPLLFAAAAVLLLLLRLPALRRRLAGLRQRRSAEGLPPLEPGQSR
ncbi:MAG: protein-methionine-sulfoxide reductase heme-binding subunit MsrQ [Chloroflexota bacterium]